MASYSTPGVYITETSAFPPSVAPVATAIPAFIGYTEFAKDSLGKDLRKKAVRITSLMEYEAMFGKAARETLSVNVTKRVTEPGGALIGVQVTWNSAPLFVPNYLLYYELQLYFANGGGPCYIYSVGPYAAATPFVVKGEFTAGITALEAVDEPTLLVFPDAVGLQDSEYGNIVDAALISCNKTQDRFAIVDVRNAVTGGTATNTDVGSNFRTLVAQKAEAFAKYGAAYFPYLSTNLPFQIADADVEIASYKLVKVKADNTEVTTTPIPVTTTPVPPLPRLDDATLDFKTLDPAVYGAVQTSLGLPCVTLPPSGVIAGVYAQVDRTRGVWKAPANVGLTGVVSVAVPITNDLQDGLNIDPATGMSVNAIRDFSVKGTLVWGARTLAGNSGDWRFINVRRTVIMAQESIGKATGGFVFEPNDANTWVKVRTMIENFLFNLWRDGGLVGAKPADAFQVLVGLNQTMTAQDILDGYLKVRVLLALSRPAEFIELNFMQQLQQS